MYKYIGSAPPQGLAPPPATTDGNIIVDGVLTSCYTDFDHDLAHFTMIPMKWFSEKMEWIFGDDTGFSIYANTFKELGRFMLPDVHYFN